MRRFISFLACLSAAGTLAQAEAWYEEDYNPNPLEDDIILPMPCDGWMVFRKIETNLFSDPETAAFADRAVHMGWNGARDSAFREGEWKTFIAGGLIDGVSRYYLIAKYEMTSEQYVAITDPTCNTDNVDFGTPHTGLTWFDAIEASHLYSVWLHGSAPEDLPSSVGTTAYVRPPTEAEWEFATRGGLAVSDSERQDGRFPMQGTIEDYAFFAGDGISNGQMQFIGKKAANPLGLFDVYGNAYEIVFDPFRINKAGRMHGHYGAMTIKGGSVRTSGADLRSGLRQEVPLYNVSVAGAITRREDVGLRLVLSGVSTGDQQHADLLAEGWAKIVDSVDDDGAPPVQSLRELADDSTDQVLSRQLNTIANSFESNLRERDELEIEALENLLQSVTLIIYRLRGLYASIEGMREILAHELDPDDQSLNRDDQITAERYQINLQDFARFADIYADAYLQLVSDYPRDQVVTVARNLREELERQDRDVIVVNLSILGISLVNHDDTAAWDSSKQILSMLQFAERIQDEPEWLRDALNSNNDQ